MQVAGARPVGTISPLRGEGLVRFLPARRLAQTQAGARIQTAVAQSNSKPETRDTELAAAPRAFVLDWQVLSSSAATYTLRSDMTYLVSSTFSVDHLKMEGGCVVKVDNNVNARIAVNDSVECLGGAYRPILFTSRYDTSVGEDITPAGSIPSNRLFTGLYLSGWNFSAPGQLTNLRMSHAGVGVVIDWGTDWTLHDCQFVNCTYPISSVGTDINLKAFNLLVRGDKAYAPAFDSGDGGTLNAQHVTVHGVNALAQGWDTKTFLNSLVVDLNYDPGTLGAGSANLWNSTGAGIFESSAAGHHYLAAASRNTGVENIDSQLLAAIRKKTTIPPEPLTSPITTPTTLSARSILDTDTPDAGFHYTPLDYSANNVTVQSTLTLKDGVAIGWRGDYAFRDGALVGTASPLKPNWIVHLASAQESPAPESLQSNARIAIEPAHAELQFTHFAMPRMSQESYHVSGWFGDLVRLQSCELFNTGLLHNKGGSMELNNCLFERGNLVADQDGYDVDTHLRNCLLKGVSLWIYQLAPVKVRDCVLWESTNSYGNGSISSSHNGYIDCPVLYGSTGHDKTGLSASTSFAPGGPLGDYYLVTDLSLINTDSRSAAAAGLYHFTTQTSQLKEGNDNGPPTPYQADIGLHYVALNEQGQPFDADADALPDHFEDRIGDGVFGAGDWANWSKWDTDNDGMSDSEEYLGGTNPNFAECPRAIYEAVIDTHVGPNPSPNYLFRLNNSRLDQSGTLELQAPLGGDFTNDVFAIGNGAFSFMQDDDRLIPIDAITSQTVDVINGGDGTKQGSISLLFRSLTGGLTTTRRYVFWQQGNSANEFGVFFEDDSAQVNPGSLHVRIGGQTEEILPGNAIDHGAWYYLAITWNEITDVATWYLGRIGGTLTSSDPINLAGNVGTSGASATEVHLGNRQGQNRSLRRSGSNGALDEIVFWSRELTETEVNDQFNRLTSLFQGPSTSFDLSHWNILLPVDSLNRLEPTSWQPLEINTGWLKSGF